MLDVIQNIMKYTWFQDFWTLQLTTDTRIHRLAEWNIYINTAKLKPIINMQMNSTLFMLGNGIYTWVKNQRILDGSYIIKSPAEVQAIKYSPT